MKHHFLTTFISLSFFYIYAQNIGVKLSTGATPNTTFDVNGSISFREGPALSLSNGVNNDIAITDYTVFRITGPTADYSITGFSNGVDGRLITIVNATSYTLTINHLTGSTSANQINTGSGADIQLPQNGTVTLNYNATLTKWLLTAAQGAAPTKLGVGMAAPAYPLDISASSNPIRIQGLQSGATTDSVMTVSATGVATRRSVLNIFDDMCKVIFKAATESVASSTTLQDDDHLFFSVNANEKWEIEALLDVDGSSGHIKYGIAIPSGSLLVDVMHCKGTGIGNTPHYLIRASGTATGQCDNDGTANTNSTRFHGMVNIGATGGNVRIQWAQFSSNSSATTVKQNSFLKATRVQ